MDGQELTRRREALGLSRMDLARKVGVSQVTIWRWETKNFRPIAATERALTIVLESMERRRPAQRSGGEQGAGTGGE